MQEQLSRLAALVCIALASTAYGQINPTDPQPTCNMCPGTYVPLAELDAYTKKAIAEKLVDQQVRDIDIGKAHIGIGMVYRGKLDKPAPNSVAGERGLSHHLRVCDAGARPRHSQSAAATCNATHRRGIQRTG